MNDLKSIVKEHLDDGAKGSDARIDHDVAVLWRARTLGGFGVSALVGAAAVGIAVGAFSFSIFGNVVGLVGPILPDDGEAELTIRKGEENAVTIKGTSAMHAAWLGSGRDLPRFLGEKTLNLHNLQMSGMSLFADVVMFDPGISFVADACVNDAHFDVVAHNAPVEVVVDAAADAFGWSLDVDGGVVTVTCDKGNTGNTTLIDGAHTWPVEAAVYNNDVDVEVEDGDVRAVVDQLAAQLDLAVRDGKPLQQKPVTLRLRKVSLRTALRVLQETSGTGVHVDNGAIVIGGPELPEWKASLELLRAQAAQAQPTP